MWNVRKPMAGLLCLLVCFLLLTSTAYAAGGDVAGAI